MQKKQLLKQQNKSTGSKGEQLAADYLLSNGYQILFQNYYLHWGELDIIAIKETTLVFVEVKTRIGFMKGKPYEAITATKMRHLMRSAQYFVRKNNYSNYKCRIDVIAIIFSDNFEVIEMNHFENITS